MREPFDLHKGVQPFGRGGAFVPLDEANAAIAQDEAAAREIANEWSKKHHALRQENEGLKEDNAALKEAVNFKSAQTPNIMLACLRGLRAQLAEQATACESLQAKLVEAVGVIEHYAASHYCAVCGFNDQGKTARQFLNKIT